MGVLKSPVNMSSRLNQGFMMQENSGTINNHFHLRGGEASAPDHREGT